MAVTVEGKLIAGVLGEVLHVLWVRAASEQNGKASVPQIMPAYVRQPRTPQQGLEVPVHYVLSVEGSTFARGEHKSIIGPHSPSPKLYLCLTLAR